MMPGAQESKALDPPREAVEAIAREYSSGCCGAEPCLMCDCFGQTQHLARTCTLLARGPLLRQAVAELEGRADVESNGSRDFGRGYMHAVRVLRDIAAGR